MENYNLPRVESNSNDVTLSVDSFSRGLQQYLNWLSLPSDDVLVNLSERMAVIENLPRVVERLKPEVRSDSMYISKFIAACGAGLFDAALNFLWNETVINLRKKVARFDLDYFINSTVGEQMRNWKRKI